MGYSENKTAKKNEEENKPHLTPHNEMDESYMYNSTTENNFNLKA